MIEEIKTSTKQYQKLISVFGKKYVTSKVESPFDFIHIATKGVNIHAVLNFSTYFNISKAATAEMLNISEPTLYRWTKINKTLERNFSIKLFEISNLFLYGIEVFGNKKNFFKWMNLPNTALGGLEPKELIEVPGGVSKVNDVLGRIEHGVYS